MSARRIARELAVIMMPQLPRDKKKLDKLEFDNLLARSVQLLTEHARQCLSEANGYIIQANQTIYETELNHPDNARKTSDVKPVALKTDDLRQQLDLLDLAMHLISEALDIPEMVLSSDQTEEMCKCNKCGHQQKMKTKRPHSSEIKLFIEELLSTYIDHHEQIDQIINTIKTKWRMERMISIDRDILRLACAEAFFMPDVPVKVAINEAVELAHRFADERAAKFINGVLATVSKSADYFRETGELKVEPLSEEESQALSK
jgi:N utilization substance protein B